MEAKFSEVEEERNSLRDYMHCATSEACKNDIMKKMALQEKLKDQTKINAEIEQHLEHLINSAGLDKGKTASLLSHLNAFLRENSQHAENLNLDIANATKSYHDALQSCRSELLKHGVSSNEVDTINALSDTSGADVVPISET